MPTPRQFVACLLIAIQSVLPASQAAQSKPAQPPLDIDLSIVDKQTYAPRLGENDESRHGHGQELPEMGDPSGTLFTPMQEKEIGETFFRSLHGEADVNQDPEVSEYIQTIGQKLASNSDNPTQPFHFFVVNDPQVNAFAGPGGYIGVNAGLILISEAESELASVLGHEIAHVTQRHLYQALQAQGKIQLLSFAAMIAAMLVGARANSGSYQNQAYCASSTQGCQRVSNPGQGLAMAAMGAGTQAMINFTRDNEAEADSIGMQILSRSEFDPRSMPDFFERMQQSTRFAGGNMPEFLLTHPVTVSRISETRSRAEKFPYRQYPDGLTYLLVRAKLRVATAATPHEAVEHFKPLTGQGTRQRQDVARYGLALALAADGKGEEGAKILQDLVAEYPNQTHFINALAKTEMDLGNRARAMDLYATARERFPTNDAIRLNYVQALLVARKPEPARRLLEDMLHGVVAPEIYEMMAQAYSQLGDEAQSHRYLAEAYYADGQTRTALMHLRLARNLAGRNFYLNAIIDDLMRKYSDEEKEKRQQQ